LDPIAAFRDDLDLDERTPVVLDRLEADHRRLRASLHEGLFRATTERGKRRGIADRLEQARLAGAVVASDDGQTVGVWFEPDLVEVAEPSDLDPGDVAQETRTGISRYR
jgi:hypothetical protein